MRITHLDHLVLTVADIPASVSFYTSVLGMTQQTFGADRTALLFGPHKINLHQAGHGFEPKATHPTPGSADLCLIVDEDLAEVATHLHAQGIPIIEGPVARTGARGPIQSLYVHDPDANLIELSTYDQSTRLQPSSGATLTNGY